MHLRIAAEHGHVVGFGRFNAEVGTGGEAQRAAVADQMDMAFRCQFLQPSGQCGLWYAVIDHDNPSDGEGAVSEHGEKAASCVFQTAMDRDDDDVGEHSDGRLQRRVAGRQVVPDIDCLLGQVATRHADPQVIEQGVGRGVGMFVHVVNGVEPGMRIAQLRGTRPQVMQQRVQPAGCHVGVMLDVPTAIEETIRVASFGGAVADEMLFRAQIGRSDVGVAR